MKRGIATLIDPDALLGALHAFAISMAIGLVLLFVLLVLQKLVLERRRRIEDETFDRLCLQLGSANGTDFPLLEAQEATHRRALSRALARLNPRDGHRNTDQASTQEALIHHLKRDTRHSQWGRRTAALEALGRLQLDDLLPYFLELARQESDRRVFGAALGAAARLCRSADHLRELGLLLVSREALSRSFNEGILYLAFESLMRRQGSDDAIVPFTASLPTGHPVLADALAAAARCGIKGTLPIAQRICTDPDSGLTLRLTALRAIGRLQPDHPVLEAALRDASWEVRTVAAGHLRSARNGALEGLRNALRDRNFHVRRNAASALSELGDPGKAVLRDMLNCDDRFARDASRTALDQPGAHHG